MTPEDRTRAAEKLHANPLLSECFDKTIANCFTAWQASRDPKEREDLWQRVKAIQLIRSEVNAAVKSALGDKQQTNPNA
jgi:hypothetical protein